MKMRRILSFAVLVGLALLLLRSAAKLQLDHGPEPEKTQLGVVSVPPQAEEPAAPVMPQVPMPSPPIGKGPSQPAKDQAPYIDKSSGSEAASEQVEELDTEAAQEEEDVAERPSTQEEPKAAIEPHGDETTGEPGDPPNSDENPGAETSLPRIELQALGDSSVFREREAPVAKDGLAANPKPGGGRARADHPVETLRTLQVSDELLAHIEQGDGAPSDTTLPAEGRYGWGVLAEYADPDLAARALGGVAVALAGGRFYRLVERGGKVSVQPIHSAGAAYGAIGLEARDSALKRRLSEAVSDGRLSGTVGDYGLWYLFPRRQAGRLQRKVATAFECQIKSEGLENEATEAFRREARLRGEVVVLARTNGGRLGVFRPLYFERAGGRRPVAAGCDGLQPAVASLLADGGNDG